MTGRVRVVIVNYNGGDLTLEAARSVLASDWPSDRLEVVVVDNASTDGSLERLRAELPDVRFIASPRNVGYGAGCNLALHDLDGVEHVALVNNDVIVTQSWLAPLVETLESGSNIGAACPKILLRDRYRPVTITAATSTGRLDPRPRGVSVSGLRAGGEDRWTRSRCRDGFWGPEYRPGEPVAQWTGNGPDATLLVPVTDGPYEIRLGADEPRVAELTVDGFTTRINVDTSPSWYPVPGGTSAFDVIHNVGVELVSDGYGADRGYLEFDDGRFDEPVDVFAWCGGAVVLSTSYLRDVGLFDERLFLYYEDVELSWRGSRAGWRYRAVPVSTVRHIHSAAASENAIRTAQWNERNRLLVLARHSTGAETRRALWHYIRATFSYARRDLVSPLLERRPPNPATVAMRARAFGGFLTSAPAFVRGPAKVPG